MSSIPFAKMNGAGNSILVADLRGTGVTLTGASARRLGADPRLRFDQLMAIRAPQSAGAAAYVDIFNIDGSRAGACGNGTRCVAWVLARTAARPELAIETASGILPSWQLDATTFAVDMGPPRVGWQDIPLSRPVPDTAAVELTAPSMPDFTRFSAVSMGNPHAVFFVPDADGVPLEVVGPRIERDAIFADRANVSMAEILSNESVKLRVWERGAGATLACGSAACATLVAAVRAGLTGREARLQLPGGELRIAWRAEDDHVIMTGPVELEYEGTLPLDGLEPAR